MKTRYRNPILTIGLMVLVLATISQAEIIPTPFVKLFKGDVYINSQLAPTGTIIDAYDADNVHCGTFTVGSIIDSAGIYGYLRVFGDDPWTDDIDEGAQSGDEITFMINGLAAEIVVDSGSVFWYDKDISEINLSVENVIVDFSIIYPPGDKGGYPDDTCRVYVGILNEGTGIDAYWIEATSTLGWTIILPLDTLPSDTIAVQPKRIPAASGEVVYAYFDVELPLWPGEDTTDNISYTVHSNLDPGLQESGSLKITIDIEPFYAMTLMEQPSDQSGDPGMTLRFDVSVRNDGNENDEYEIITTSASGWTTIDQPGTVPADPDELASLYFNVVLPTSIGSDDISDVITYQIKSLNDPELFVEYYVTATALAQDQYAVYITDRPSQKSGEVGTTVRFNVGARNDGNTADEFYISATADIYGWTVTPQPGTIPVSPGATVDLYFDVTIPSGADDGDMELLTYTVTSNSDPSAFGTGEVTLVANDGGTDVDDGDIASMLPGRVSLAQNYPNPFNPTTTISFDLPARSRVRLDIINVLGRTVDELELGQLPGGDHQVEYDGSALASGVYFYHLSTDFGQVTKKMILLK